MQPKKQWGQNFLRNRGAVDRIVAAIEAEADDVILEIGPGEGVLTEKLAELPNAVTAIEIDPELSANLEQRFGERIDLRLEDAVEAPPPSPPHRAVGNLPYNVGTPILRRVRAGPKCPPAGVYAAKEMCPPTLAQNGDDSYTRT